MQKLSNVESQRILAVLIDTLERIKCIKYVPSHVDANAISQLIEHQCHDAAQLLDTLWNLETCIGKEELQGCLDEIKRVSRDLCRHLRQNPVSLEILYHIEPIGQEDQGSVELLINAVSDLIQLTQGQLENSFEEMKSKKELVRITESRFKQSEDERIMTRDNLADLRTTKENEIAALQLRIQKLQNEIQLHTKVHLCMAYPINHCSECK